MKVIKYFKKSYEIGLTCETLIMNASVVWPDNVRPLLSTIVPDIIIGNGSYSFSNKFCRANKAAFAFAVSKMVSTIIISQPESNKPLACSVYDSTSSSNALNYF